MMTQSLAVPDPVIDEDINCITDAWLEFVGEVSNEDYQSSKQLSNQFQNYPITL